MNEKDLKKISNLIDTISNKINVLFYLLNKLSYYNTAILQQNKPRERVDFHFEDLFD